MQYIFLLLIFPLSFVYFLNIKHLQGDKISFQKGLIVSFFGFVLGAFVCAYKAFFMLPSNANINDVYLYTLLQWFEFAVFPLAVCFGLFLLWCKDSVRFRVRSFSFFMQPFCCIYVPYNIIGRSTYYSFFELMVYPALLLCMIVFIMNELNILYDALKKKSISSVLSLLYIGIATIVPCICRALWFFELHGFLWFGLSLLYLALSVYRSRCAVIKGCYKDLLTRFKKQ